MIEIKIPEQAAIQLLMERMRFELEMRIKAGIYSRTTQLENLTYQQIFDLVECSAFDIISLLPPDILIDRSNLPSIIAKAIKSLSKIYSYYEFNLYSEEKAERLILPIKKLIIKNKDREQFTVN
ncbi:MAG: hypothetical protein K9J12_12795 [Melioribacteraceae bacterium]|nr:hypothetical protein [Melioribacteraceae bacterium]MCF8412819.1 hypothetical protein [Melioribacteraceae bacterium]MCF8431153.1 hypothetical protein [Melioribacteraceae bacterium]